MRHFKCLCVWTLLLTFWTFLGVRVGQDYESQTDFSRYKGFGWAGLPQEIVEASLLDSPLVAKRIHDADSTAGITNQNNLILTVKRPIGYRKYQIQFFFGFFPIERHRPCQPK